MTNRITPQSRPLDVLIAVLHELHICKTFYTVDTISNMQLADLNYKPHGEKVSGVLLTMKLAHSSIRHHNLNITNVFASTGPIDTLTAKCNYIINKTENNEVYTVKKL